MNPDLHCDVVIIGGGITGLWLSAVLGQSGYRTVLLEKSALGAGQTLAAQGIIHGGTKYALTGKLTGSSEAVRVMPERWHSHLTGQSNPDLSQVKVNTRNQWMWSADGLGSKIAGFFASKMMTSRVSRVAGEQLPESLKNKIVYQLDEPVLDVASLLQVLHDQSHANVYQAEVKRIVESDDRVRVEAGSTVLETRLVIGTAGEGNEALMTDVPMQRRPLHMVMVKGNLPEIWAHIIEADAVPRMTITTHKSGNQTMWYLGGRLAEEGVDRARDEQIGFAQQEIKTLLPSLDWQNMQWSAFKVNRAEGSQPGTARPDTPVISQQGRMICIWPTKLAFAPLVADEVQEIVQTAITTDSNREYLPVSLEKAGLGQYPWDEAVWT